MCIRDSVSYDAMLKLENVSNRTLKLTALLRQQDEGGKARVKWAGEKHSLVQEIEKGLAEFARELLACMLIPYWRDRRTGLVESQEADELPIKARRSEAPVVNTRVPMELHAGPTLGRCV